MLVLVVHRTGCEDSFLYLGPEGSKFGPKLFIASFHHVVEDRKDVRDLEHLGVCEGF